MSDARKRAEEALALYSSYCARRIDDENFDAPTLRETVLAMARDLRALLTEQVAGVANPDIPESCRVDEDGCCVVCGRDVIGDTCCSLAARKPLAPAPAPFDTAVPAPENDEGHWELGLRLQIARAKGELPSDETPDPAWAAWAQRLLDDATAYRERTGGAAVREAETVYCRVCAANPGEPCYHAYADDIAPYPHPERSVAAKLAARGGE